jgi:hypothetical protein
MCRKNKGKEKEDEEDLPLQKKKKQAAQKSVFMFNPHTYRKEQ